jgi:ammonium transporter
LKSLFLALVAITVLTLSAGRGFADAPATPQADAAKPAAADAPADIDRGDTAWMLVATAFVMLMVPGLALFYGGMVRRKNVLATMMQSMVALSVVGVFWIAVGYGLAFGPSHGGLIGWDNRFFFLSGFGPKDALGGTSIPVYVHAMYQGMFAIITPALISGAVAERIRFKPYCLFLIAWIALVYCPLAHWVWATDAFNALPLEAGKKLGESPAGWLGKLGALDFAGGTVVHVAAGLSSLAAILLLRKRLGYPEHAMHPNSMVLTLTGAGLLWFGWFGFNGGSGLQSGALAGSAFSATQAAAAAAGLSWMLIEWWHRGKPTALGLASGIVAGLVAVTPASGYVYPWGGLVIGLIAGVVCYGSVCLKPRFGYDDSLDAFGVHGVGGFLGAILTGVFCYKAVNDSGADGLLAGNVAQVGIQALAAVSSVVFTFGLTLILVKVIDQLVGFAAEPRAETEGLDRSEHGEVGFDFGLATESAPEAPTQEPRPATVPPDGHKRFTVVVEGATNGDLIHAWSDLCQVGAKPASPEFKVVYPYLTTVQGNRFRFRGGDPILMRDNLQRLFRNYLGGGAPVRAHVEQ